MYCVRETSFEVGFFFKVILIEHLEGTDCAGGRVCPAASDSLLVGRPRIFLISNASHARFSREWDDGMIVKRRFARDREAQDESIERLNFRHSLHGINIERIAADCVRRILEVFFGWHYS